MSYNYGKNSNILDSQYPNYQYQNSLLMSPNQSRRGRNQSQLQGMNSSSNIRTTTNNNIRGDGVTKQSDRLNIGTSPVIQKEYVQVPVEQPIKRKPVKPRRKKKRRPKTQPKTQPKVVHQTVEVPVEKLVFIEKPVEKLIEHTIEKPADKAKINQLVQANMQLQAENQRLRTTSSTPVTYIQQPQRIVQQPQRIIQQPQRIVQQPQPVSYSVRQPANYTVAPQTSSYRVLPQAPSVRIVAPTYTTQPAHAPVRYAAEPLRTSAYTRPTTYARAPATPLRRSVSPALDYYDDYPSYSPYRSPPRASRPVYRANPYDDYDDYNDDYYYRPSGTNYDRISRASDAYPYYDAYRYGRDSYY